ncbi:hypothetical protein B0T14DRAFT_513533 [Immersiella caudata]|uniref:Uncharacterized protein n=1 Tax=Immersiella caudata TaxID=314043 RepID=A0AA39X5Y4_9PEZI|nr:hypothetical protein B0T14DRAFT_513533 [Immersiella caudata]
MSPSSTSLLGLPLEVRDMIILSVIQSPQSIPPTSSDLLDQRREPDTRYHRILYPAKPPNNPALSLLLANRQLHTETREALRRVFPATDPKPLNYNADIVYLKDNGTFWLTWLSVPTRTSHIDTLHAQFRIFSFPPLVDYDLAVGVPKTFDLHWVSNSLIVLLENTLGSAERGPCGKPISMNRLVLDFVRAEGSAGELLPVAPWARPRRRARDREEVPTECFPLRDDLRAECADDPGMEAAARLMCYFLRYLDWIVGDATFIGTWFYGKILFENVGVVEVWLNGKMYETLDLGYMLANMRYWGDAPGSYRYGTWHDKFIPWRRETQGRRRELGMPV